MAVAAVKTGWHPAKTAKPCLETQNNNTIIPSFEVIYLFYLKIGCFEKVDTT